MRQTLQQKTIRNELKAESVDVTSSTTHHHPDQFCQDKRRENKRSVAWFLSQCEANILKVSIIQLLSGWCA